MQGKSALAIYRLDHKDMTENPWMEELHDLENQNKRSYGVCVDDQFGALLIRHERQEKEIMKRGNLT